MRINGKGLNFLGQGLLLSATLVWGSSFIILKEAIKEVPALYLIGIRFAVAALLLSVIFFKKIIKINVRALLHGTVLGVTLALAYITQTLGLKEISAGKNAFITSLYCMLCPFMLWLFYGVKPKSYNIISAALCFTGIGFVALSGAGADEGNSLLGGVFTFLCAIFFALQIIFTGRFHEKKDDAIVLLTVQLFVAAIITFAYSAIFEIKEYGISAYQIDGKYILTIAYLTVFCTLYAQLAQMLGLKYTNANQASVILSLEAVFGVIFAVILGNESITALLLLGFALIFTGTLISELKPKFFGFFAKKQNEQEDKDDNKEVLE